MIEQILFVLFLFLILFVLIDLKLLYHINIYQTNYEPIGMLINTNKFAKKKDD